MYNYQHALELGFDGVKDFIQAFRWIKEAEKGQKIAQNRLDHVFLDGWQCQKSLEETAN
jgi:TPR repeat protein